jgi:trans-2,3-dihydro-3-hydroxyanthranilate isomerase
LAPRRRAEAVAAWLLERGLRKDVFMTVRFLEYDVVDVFAHRPLAGNQLAVVHGAAELSDSALLSIAQEFNLPETTFPTPMESGRFRNRIFTPRGEIPFAGHPTVGTAWVLRARGEVTEREVVQECGAGEIGVRLEDDRIEFAAVPRDLVGPLDGPVVSRLVEALGLERDDIIGDTWLAGTGLTFVHLPVHDEAVARAAVPRRAVRHITDLPETGDPLEGINLYAVRARSDDGLDVHSRVFVGDPSVPEDPATGSAAAGLGMALQARSVLTASGRYTISQGSEMGRPSLLEARVDQAEDTLRVLVAGTVHPFARGQIRVP